MSTAMRRAGMRRQAQEQLAALRLQRLRQARNLTQEETALAMGVSQGSLSKLERRTNVTMALLRRYVAAIGGRLEVSVLLPPTAGPRQGTGGSRTPGRRVHLVLA